MEKRRSIFDVLLQALENVNRNVVDLSAEVVALRRDVAEVKGSIMEAGESPEEENQ